MAMEIESYEDDFLLPLPEQPPSSPIRHQKLKRLKKSSSAPTVRVSSADPVVLNSNSLDLSDIGKNSDEFDDGLDPLFSFPAADEGFQTLGLEKEGETEKARDDGMEMEMEEEKKSVRKRLSLEESEEEISKKKKKKKNLDGKSKESAREKKRIEKERHARLEQIHAESQRLLRETRDASFKPVPLVHKPISSILEKIRLRKLEVLKRSGILCKSVSVPEEDCPLDEIAWNPDSNKTQIDARDSDAGVEVGGNVHVVGAESNSTPEDRCASLPCDDVAVLELNVASHTSANDTQDIGRTSESTEHKVLNDLNHSADQNLATLDVNHDPDYLSSEEDDDKENIDPFPEKENINPFPEKENINPHISGTVNMDSSPSGGLAKDFIDFEAEEEDDSDHDITRFPENEEDYESDENDVDDLIATGYEEAPMDNDKRNQLHQQWLEQQDAAGTDNLLQRLNCGQRQRELTSLNDDVDDESDDESDDEASHDLPVISVVRQNAKKAKQMIAQMFTDGNDVYVHSDDEESEQTVIRQRVLKRTGESSFISAVDDENSSEVFGLIKKLNIAPPTKRRKIATSTFDTFGLGGNSNTSSKTSFLNRTSSNSLPSLHKQGSTTVKAFIFGRDDSNSRSSIQTSEDVSQMDTKENKSSKASASTKFRGSSQFTASKMTTETKPGSGSSLFQILRHSSMHFDRQLKNNKGINSREFSESQAAYKFSAFKLQSRR